MIVKCRLNDLSRVPKEYLEFGPDTLGTGKLACTPDRHYPVFAHRVTKTGTAGWYFIVTDNHYLWWMPASAFDVIDEAKPKGWIEVEERNGDKLWSYPSLQNWTVEEGIIDGEKAAVNKYFSEVDQDHTFPSTERLRELNKTVMQKLKKEEFEEQLKQAKENGWEVPEKPQELL